MTLAQLENERAATAARMARHERRTGLLWAAAIIILLVGGGYVLLRPLSSDELASRVAATLAAATDRGDALRDVEPLIALYLTRAPQGPQATAMRGLKREIDVDRLRIRAERRERRSVPPTLRIERDYRQAMALKSADPTACLAALEAIRDLPDSVAAAPLAAAGEADPLVRDAALWRALAAWQIEQLAPLHEAEQRIDRHHAPRQ